MTQQWAADKWLVRYLLRGPSCVLFWLGFLTACTCGEVRWLSSQEEESPNEMSFLFLGNAFDLICCRGVRMKVMGPAATARWHEGFRMRDERPLNSGTHRDGSEPLSSQFWWNKQKTRMRRWTLTGKAAMDRNGFSLSVFNINISKTFSKNSFL